MKKSNNKKSWRKAVPELINKIFSNKESSVHIPEAELKISTVPRLTVKRKLQANVLRHDVWGDTNDVHEGLSKRKRLQLERKAPAPKVQQLPINVLSYRPTETDLVNVLSKLEADQKETEAKRLSIMRKLQVIEDDDVVEKDKISEEFVEDYNEENAIRAKKNKEITRRQKKVKMLRSINIEKRNMQNKLEKAMKVEMNNIHRLGTEVKKLKKKQIEMHDQRIEKNVKHETKKDEKKELAKIDFMLPDEIPTSLRTIKPDGDYLTSIVENYKVVKPKRDGKRKFNPRRYVKHYKKHGLV